MSCQDPFTENIELSTYGYTRLDQGTILFCTLQRKKRHEPPANYQTDDTDFDTETEALIDEETGFYTPLPTPHQSQQERRKKKKNKKTRNCTLPKVNCGCDWTLEVLAVLLLLVLLAPVAYMILVWNNALMAQYVERSQALSSQACEASLDASPYILKRGESRMVMEFSRGPGKPVITMSSLGGLGGSVSGGLSSADVPTIALTVGSSPTPTPSSSFGGRSSSFVTSATSTGVPRETEVAAANVKSPGLIDRFWSEMLGV